MMTRILRKISLLMLLIGLGLDCSSKPIDSDAAQRLLELEKISSVIDRSNLLSAEQWAVIEKSLASGDDVSVAVATLFLQRINSEQSRALLVKLVASDTRRSLIVDSVLKTGQVKSELATAKPSERAAEWQKLATDSNPYSRIAAAKALCAIDPTMAKAVLLRLEEEKSEISPAANRLRRELAAQMGEELPPPIPGFETIYTWFERSAGALDSVRFAGSSAAPPQEGSSTEPTPVLQPPAPKKAPETKPTTSTPSEEPSSSMPWSVLVILVMSLIALLLLLLKRRS
ncbi:hypothetical protein [Prosthecobacter sp.]|uniref:hypothetical protein n=1 Tax=Prosthecobacter sp. TaxID=1965333 RepID=UPI003783AE07